MIDWHDPSVAASLPDRIAISTITAAELAGGPHLAAVVSDGRKPRKRFADLLIASTARADQLDLYTRIADDFAGLEHLIRVIAI